MPIICPPESDITLKFASDELRHYFTLITPNYQKMEQFTSTYPSIIFSIHLQEIPAHCPKKAITAMENYKSTDQLDAYGIIVQESEIFIFGRSSRAVLFGAYDLLRQLGFNWFFPGKKFEMLPSELDFTRLKPFKIKIPLFRVRGAIISGKLKDINGWIDYAAKSRLNTIILTDIKHYYKAQEEALRRGLQLEAESSALSDESDSFCAIQKPLFEKSMVGFLKYLDDMPISTENLYFFPSNDYLKRCSCKIDKNLHMSDLVLRRLNFLSNHPKVRNNQQIIFRAMSGTWHLPIRSRPGPKISLEIAPDHRCMSHSIADPFCKFNNCHVKDPLSLFLRMFSVKNTVIADYWLDALYFAQNAFSTYNWNRSGSFGRLFHNPALLKRDLHYYASIGIEKILSHARGLNESYYDMYISPIIWLYPQLVWNPELNISEMQKEFCRIFFGTNRSQLFFDETEPIDPQDLSKSNFNAFQSLNLQRICLLNDLLRENYTIKQKNRIQLYIKELQFKQDWQKRYWIVRTRGILNRWWFIIRQLRC